VIVDAAFLKRHQRDQLRVVADQTRVRFVILDVQTPESVLRARLQRRVQHEREASEADLAVLDRQLASGEPLTAEEQRHVLVVDGAASADITGLASTLRARIGLA
jgi:predicted kinase